MSIIDDMNEELYAAAEGKTEEKLAPTVPPTEGIESIVNELMVSSLDVVTSALKFADLDPETDMESPPQEWVDKLGEKEAKKAHRVALYAMAPSRAAPMGLVMAQKMLLGGMAARMKQSEGEPLKVAVVQMPPIDTTYRELEETTDDH